MTRTTSPVRHIAVLIVSFNKELYKSISIIVQVTEKLLGKQLKGMLIELPQKARTNDKVHSLWSKIVYRGWHPIVLVHLKMVWGKRNLMSVWWYKRNSIETRMAISIDNIYSLKDFFNMFNLYLFFFFSLQTGTVFLTLVLIAFWGLWIFR